MEKPDKMQWCSKRASDANLAYAYERASSIHSQDGGEGCTPAHIWDPEDFFAEYDELYGDHR